MNVFMWRWDPDFRDFALHSPLAELGATLLEADKVSLFYDQAFIKEPGTREVTHWHQDMPFWPARGNDIISLWVALTPVTLEGSGVEYVAGSHKWGKFYQAQTPDKDGKFTDAALEPCPNFSRVEGRPEVPIHLVGLPARRCHLPPPADGSWRRRKSADQPALRDFRALCGCGCALGSAHERDEMRRRAGSKAQGWRSACPRRRIPRSPGNADARERLAHKLVIWEDILCAKILFAAAVAAVAIASRAQAQEKLKFAVFTPDAEMTHQVIMKPWAEKVSKESGGTLDIQTFPNGALGRNPGLQTKMMQDGVADIAWVIPSYTPGVYLDDDVFELPNVIQDSTEGSVAAWRLLQKGMLRGYDQYHMIGLFTTSPYTFHTNFPARKPEDLKGKKIRAVGAISTDSIKAIGAVPEGMPVTQVVEAIRAASSTARTGHPIAIFDFGISRVDDQPLPWQDRHRDARHLHEQGEVRQPAAAGEGGDREKQRRSAVARVRQDVRRPQRRTDRRVAQGP